MRILGQLRSVPPFISGSLSFACIKHPPVGVRQSSSSYPCPEVNIPRPQLDWDWISHPDNHQNISENIKLRKSKASIDKVTDLYKEIYLNTDIHDMKSETARDAIKDELLSAGLVLPTESLWQTGAGSGSLTQVEGLIYELANTHTLFSWTFSRKYIPASEVESRKTSGRLRVLTFLSSSSASLVHSQLMFHTYPFQN